MRINSNFKPIYLFMLALAPIFSSCDDFFEVNIEGKVVEVLSPTDGFSSPLQSVTFWWEPLAGATSYEIQVVSRSFENIQKVWADSIVEGTQIILILVPGDFQWRIRGMNSAYSTSYQTYSFSVEYNTDLEEQELVLKTPSDNFFTNSSQISFSWFELTAAESYVFALRTSSGSAVESPIETQLTALTFPDDFEIDDLPDGEYIWSVRALNWFSTTPLSSRTFSVDRENPSVPILLFPADNDTLSVGNIDFSWEQLSESIAPIFDSIYVQSINGPVSIKQRATSFSATINLAVGKYRWRVRSFDLAGNSSQSTIDRNLWIE